MDALTARKTSSISFSGRAPSRLVNAVLWLLLLAFVLALPAPVSAAKARDYYTRTMAFDFRFRDIYSPEDIQAYTLALKRKDFSARIQWKPLLVVAADNGDLKTVRWMLENGVRADTADQTGRDALYHLANRDPARVTPHYAEIAKLLLLSGADPNRFATGSSVVRALTSGNRDIAPLKVALAFGADPNGNPGDMYPPVCGAGTAEFIDTLYQAGARLVFPERKDFSNVADCLALDDLDKKERKAVLKHLETVYGIVPASRKSSRQAVAETVSNPAQTATHMALHSGEPALLKEGNYFYVEQTFVPVARGITPEYTLDYRVLAVPVAMTRQDIIDQVVQPQNFRMARAKLMASSLQRCASDCAAELKSLQDFVQRHALVRVFREQAAPSATFASAGEINRQ